MDTVFSVQQVAERIGVTPDMVRKAIRQGHLKAQSLSQEGRRPLYIVTEAALQDYVRRPKGKPGRKPKSREATRPQPARASGRKPKKMRGAGGQREPVSMSVTQSISPLLTELKEALQGVYGQRFRGLYLYGSYARGEALVDSDVDVLIILESIESYGAEIDRTGSIISSLSLKYGVSISRVFVSQQDWAQRSTSFLATVRDEAIPA